MMSAVRIPESAASTSGISVNAIKITLFAVTAHLAGFGGVLLVAGEQRGPTRPLKSLMLLHQAL
jgi:ribose/xylose/arabinose/galactoside ABC-type transport system permease subunit